ncbi:MAG: imidazoleglycerol-phosphate dehydratase HisB [Fimbriimonadales bacterium]|nr:imidazoleglycerol-phosphate dehydratase HisB [Fimbriimonadales bacterium]
MNTRSASTERRTTETDVKVEVNLDGQGEASISSGVGFLDHMLATLVKHSKMDIRLTCAGDIHVDDHHTAEDCAIALGKAIDSALGERTGIKRFGYAYAPLDEALSRAVVDLSGRAHSTVSLALVRDKLGQLSCENVSHFISSLASSLRAAIHVDLLRGENDHHKAESAFKALALALRMAIERDHGGIPSTKGVL